MDQVLTYEAIATVGLMMDMVGVVMLFYYGMPPRIKSPKKWDGLAIASPYELVDSPVGSDVEPSAEHLAYLRRWKRRNSILSHLAITLVVVGFGLQIWAILL